MSNLVTAIAFIVLLGGLVFVHELGHFLAAKFFNVKVLKFSLGFGPRVWGFRRGETEYQLAALPLGGFVKMAGENPAEEVSPEDRARSFSAQKPYRRAIIAFAGPFVNLTLPVAVYFLMNLAPQMKEPPIVGAVIPNEPAEVAGVQPGDRIVSIDGQPTESFEAMREAIEARPGREIEVTAREDVE
jgi:regulator of sigma E protease